MIAAPQYTRDQLEAMIDRELDAVVAEIVMGIAVRVPKRCMHTGAVHHEETVIRTDLPFYSSGWLGFGMVVERMLGHGFKPDVRPMAADRVEFGWTRLRVVAGRNRWSCTDQFGPRAAAISAVLAVQEAA